VNFYFVQYPLLSIWQKVNVTKQKKNRIKGYKQTNKQIMQSLMRIMMIVNYDSFFSPSMIIKHQQK